MIVLVSLIFAAALLIIRSLRRVRPFPPGPRPLPIVGNLHQIPRKNRWRTFKKWHDIYGPVVSFYLGSQLVISLGSHQSAQDLLGKRGAIYSSRPHYYPDATGSGVYTVTMPYSPAWRIHRRISKSLLDVKKARDYRVLQDVESKQLLFELLSTGDFAGGFRRYSTSLISALAYGKRIVRGDEHELEEISRIMKAILEEADPPTAAYPMLNCLPFALAPWKKTAESLEASQTRLYEKCVDNALQVGPWNWTKEAIHSTRAENLDRKELAYVIGVLFGAGSHTTAAVLEVFVLASLAHKAAVCKAQAQLDSVVGDQMPGWDDISHLNYIEAFVYEVLRWRPVAPTGLHHEAIQNDEYIGYQIPKGTPIIPCHWSMEFDEDVFEDPWEFNPDRWIENPKLPSSAFGFGRRICPGEYVAKNSLILIMARMLWAFDFVQPKGAQVDTFNLTAHGVSSRPQPFPVHFAVRSEKHHHVIEREWNRAETDLDVIMASVEG